MKKKKLFEVSLINKAYSRVIQNTTRFYTSDTALEIGFDIVEMEYTFDSAEIILLNETDRSLVTRELARSGKGFTYELESDIIEHYGNWAAQLKLEKDGEVYISSPVGFSIENDLYNSRPPKLSEVNTWKNLRKIADGLISDIRSELESVSEQLSEIESAESERQSAESERQSAELLRIENEKQRNLTSVEEFVKLQDAVGGRNLTRGNTDVIRTTTSGDNRAVMLVEFGVRNFKANTDYTISVNVKAQTGIKKFNYNYLWASSPDTLGNVNIWSIDLIDDGEWHRYTKTFNFPIDRYGEVRLGLDSRQADVSSNVPLEFTKWKLEEGPLATPYTKAPEDYTTVTKDDYYNHIKLMSELTRSEVRGKANKKQDDWITLPLYNGAQHGDSPLKVMKDEMGVVHFKGSLTNLVSGSKVFSVPVGYGPDIGVTESYIRVPVTLSSGRELNVVQINYVGDGYIINPSKPVIAFFDSVSYLAKRG